MYNGLPNIYEVNGSSHERHVYAGDIHIASNTTGTIQYYHVDHLGSTRLRTAANSLVIYERIQLIDRYYRSVGRTFYVLFHIRASFHILI